ncbi:radical SAM protein [uncultured Methanobrevibacter sp.]|uniref:radical SAM protein n=1 Tax=uncultured Methanobrevibacter sp. TaxID=253161 RepID=UPI0025D3304A|nr:radical SAM protein [uncultured Methanobrevibacter sp.]
MSLKNGIKLKKTMFVVTTKCNIKCDNCNSFINKYIFPISYDRKTLVSDARNLLEFVDSIEELVILGGETFLNRNLDYLLEYLFEGEYSNKVETITISTNGTIIPNIETLKILKKHKEKNTIIISKYFDMCETIVPELKKFDINYVINEQVHGEKMEK